MFGGKKSGVSESGHTNIPAYMETFMNTKDIPNSRNLDVQI
jgi:hypothetical protein